MAPRIAILGGGYSGTCTAVALARRSAHRVSVALVDPATRPGRGRPYATEDPDHRLNAPTFIHTLLPDDAWHFDRWCRTHRVLEHDPEARQADGSTYPRRAVFGDYVQQTLDAYARGPDGRLAIEPMRGTAVDAVRGDRGWSIALDDGRQLDADAVVLATGLSTPRLPAPFAALDALPALVRDGLDAGRLAAIAPAARVLVVGTGLTALDAIATLLRRDHRGPIVAVSRHGLRPRRQGPLPPEIARALDPAVMDTLAGDLLLRRFTAPPPAWLQPADTPATVRTLLRALRRRIDAATAAGGTWYAPFDELRDAASRVWAALPDAQRRRFARTLRTWYDVHRFRSPPPIEAAIDAAIAAGRLRIEAARIVAARTAPDDASIAVTLRPRGEDAHRIHTFDAVLVCSGHGGLPEPRDAPLAASLADQGRLRVDAVGMGLDVDPFGCAIGTDGHADPTLRIVGPPSVGAFGDPIGAIFIAVHVHRVAADLLRTLDVQPRGSASP